MIEMYIYSFIATIGATILGGFLAIYVSKIKKSYIQLLQSFALGSLLVFVIMHLLAESLEEMNEIFDNGIIYAILIIIATLAFFLLLHFVTSKIFHKHDHSHHDHHNHDNEHTNCDAHDVCIQEDKSLLLNSIIFLVSITLHNIPEGMSLGIIFTQDVFSASIISITVFFLHNLVVGYLMCHSFMKSGVRKLFSFMLSVSAAVVSYALAIGGYYIGSIGESVDALLLCVSAGAIIYVLVQELLPEFKESITVNNCISLLLGIGTTVLILMV